MKFIIFETTNIDTGAAEITGWKVKVYSNICMFRYTVVDSGPAITSEIALAVLGIEFKIGISVYQIDWRNDE